MTLIDVIEVPCNGTIRRIELHQGDLTQLAPEDRVDVLIVSAFPGDYSPTPTSLIGALSAKGLSVAALATDKAQDLRRSFSCWMSQPVVKQNSGLYFNRILCFEPRFRGNPPDVVGDIFRALAPFLGGESPIRTAAMPIVAAGDQGHSVYDMLPPIVEAAVHWMGIGMPLDILKVFAYSPRSGAQAAEAFSQLKNKFTTPPLTTPSYQYDVFISYCRADVEAADALRAHLSQHELRVFIDTQTLKKGAAWQHHIFRALDDCSRVIAVYSQSYVNSKVCQEEFNIAWARGRNHDIDCIYPIYWSSAQLPTYMTMLNFFDCREAQLASLKDACSPLLRELQAQKDI